jgi:hypothetical protein
MEYVDIDYEYVHETHDAVCIFDGDEEYWIPKSVIEDGHSTDWSKEDTMPIAQWFAEQEGLI